MAEDWIKNYEGSIFRESRDKKNNRINAI